MSEPEPDLLEETPKQRFIGARDLTHWPSAAGRLAVRLGQRAGRWLAPNQVLALILLIALACLAVVITAHRLFLTATRSRTTST